MSQPSDSSSHVVWHEVLVTREDRRRLNRHPALILWFTGLPAAGKSTIASAVEHRLHPRGIRTYLLDGDNVRHGLCSNLGFSPEDRTENIRRVGEVAKLFVDAGVLTLTAFISPYRADRDRVRALVQNGDFIEIYCECPVNVCEQRDPKGHYKKARAGIIREFTGVSAPYELPLQPELTLDTGSLSVQESADRVLRLLADRGVLAHQPSP